MQNKPNLFIVGAPKCGTTSLYHYLAQHPDVFFSTPKEVNFFSKESLEKHELYYIDYKPANLKEYLGLFKGATPDHIFIGEASVSYFGYPEVAKNIFDFNPEAKIVILLRDPVKRAWSHYLMDKRLGLVKKDFIDIFHSKSRKDNLHNYQYFHLGNYSTHIQRYIECFGVSNVFIGFLDDLKSNSSKFMESLFCFLEIKNININNFTQHNRLKSSDSKLINQLYKINSIRSTLSKFLPNEMKTIIESLLFNAPAPSISKRDEDILRQYYHQEITALENTCDIDLSHWK